MYDVIYLVDENNFLNAQNDLKSNFTNSRIEDASDEFHHNRLSIELEINDKEYFFKLLDMELALCSLRFNIYAMNAPKKCKKLIEEWKGTQHKTKQVIGDLQEEEENLKDG